MTRKEAIKILEIIDMRFMTLDVVERQALVMAIKALEQMPCEDAISREQAMAIIYKTKENYRSDRENYPINYGTLCDINLQLVNLPPVTPKAKTDVLDKIKAEIIELRSRQNVGVLECLDIIDKYKVESEE